MCGVLGVPRATYYWMLSHPEPEPADDPAAADVVQDLRGEPPRVRRPEDKARARQGGRGRLQAAHKEIMDQKGLASAYTCKSTGLTPPKVNGRGPQRAQPGSSAATSAHPHSRRPHVRPRRPQGGTTSACWSTCTTARSWGTRRATGRTHGW